jgi:hypothetical protein
LASTNGRASPEGRDRSSRPYHSSHATSAEVVDEILYLRENYHFGPFISSAWRNRKQGVSELVPLGSVRPPSGARRFSITKTLARPVTSIDVVYG